MSLRLKSENLYDQIFFLSVTILLIQLNVRHLMREGLLGYFDPPTTHTSCNSFYKWTKISSLEIIIFYLKMMVKSGLEFFF